MKYEYPYTDFHEINLDYIMKLARESLGLNLVVEGNKLLLKNDLGETISNVTIHYADTSLNDVDGNPIKSYIFSAGTESDNVIFTKGDGTTTIITVPYATKATNDVTGRNITQYLVNVTPSEKRITFTRGDGTTFSFEVPYAQTALGDKNSKDITTYVANISTNGDDLIVTDGNGLVLSQFKVTYAEKAKNDIDGDAIKSYAKVLQTGERTVKLLSKEGNVLSEITVPFATMAMEDTSGHSLLEDYGVTLDAVNNDVVLKSFSGKTLSNLTVPFATLSTDATNAIERVEVSGNNVAFTTHGGTRYEITAPYALKATDDGSGNTITKNYIAAVEKNSTTGDFVFKAKDGTEIARLVSESETAKNDTFGNLIANYIKTIVVSDESNYVVVTHGDGTVDTLTINYASQAWKDTYGNIIGNFYIGFLKCINDEKTGDPVVVAYNGENAELFRFSVRANSAKYDDEGNNIYTSYAASLTYTDDTLKLLSKSGDELSSVTLDIPEPITGYGKSLSITDQTLTLKDENSNDLSSVTLPTPDLTTIESDINSLKTEQSALDGRVETIENSLDTMPEIVDLGILTIEKSRQDIIDMPFNTDMVAQITSVKTVDEIMTLVNTLRVDSKSGIIVSKIKFLNSGTPYPVVFDCSLSTGVAGTKTLRCEIPQVISATNTTISLVVIIKVSSDNISCFIQKVGRQTAIRSGDDTLNDTYAELTIGEGLSVDNNGVLSATGGEPYILPTASTTTLGGIKVGTNLSITSDGTLSAPTPTAPYELPTASTTTLGGVKIGDTMSITSTGILDTDNFIIALKYDPTTHKYSSYSAKSSKKPFNKSTSIIIHVYKNEEICYTTHGNYEDIGGDIYVMATLNLSEIFSPGSSSHSSIYGTLVMRVTAREGYSSISIANQFVSNNNVFFNAYSSSALTDFITISVGFTSDTDLTPLFRYNNFIINPKNTNQIYYEIKPIEIIYNSPTEIVYFYYILNDGTTETSARYIICDSYNVSTETYDHEYWKKRILE